MLEDEGEQLDWDNDDDEQQDQRVNDDDDAVSIGGAADDANEYYAYAQAQGKSGVGEQFQVNASRPTSPGGSDRFERGSSQFDDSSRFEKTPTSQTTPMRHALPVKPVGAEMPYFRADYTTAVSTMRPALPHPWQEKTSSRSGQTFYWNPIEQETTWIRPTGPLGDTVALQSPTASKDVPRKRGRYDDADAYKMDSYVPGGDTSDPPLRRTRRDESRRRDHADTDRGSSQPNESNDTWISPEYRSSRIAAPARPDVSRQLPSRLTDDVYIPGQTFAKGPPSPRGRRARSPRRSRDRDHTSYLSGQLPPPINTTLVDDEDDVPEELLQPTSAHSNGFDLDRAQARLADKQKQLQNQLQQAQKSITPQPHPSLPAKPIFAGSASPGSSAQTDRKRDKKSRFGDRITVASAPAVDRHAGTNGDTARTTSRPTTPVEDEREQHAREPHRGTHSPPQESRRNGHREYSPQPRDPYYKERERSASPSRRVRRQYSQQPRDSYNERDRSPSPARPSTRRDAHYPGPPRDSPPTLHHERERTESPPPSRRVHRDYSPMPRDSTPASINERERSASPVNAARRVPLPPQSEHFKERKRPPRDTPLAPRSEVERERKRNASNDVPAKLSPDGPRGDRRRSLSPLPPSSPRARTTSKLAPPAVTPAVVPGAWGKRGPLATPLPPVENAWDAPKRGGRRNKTLSANTVPLGPTPTQQASSPESALDDDRVERVDGVPGPHSLGYDSYRPGTEILNGPTTTNRRATRRERSPVPLSPPHLGRPRSSGNRSRSPQLPRTAPYDDERAPRRNRERSPPRAGSPARTPAPPIHPSRMSSFEEPRSDLGKRIGVDDGRTAQPSLLSRLGNASGKRDLDEDLRHDGRGPSKKRRRGGSRRGR